MYVVYDNAELSALLLLLSVLRWDTFFFFYVLVFCLKLKSVSGIFQGYFPLSFS